MKSDKKRRGARFARWVLGAGLFLCSGAYLLQAGDLPYYKASALKPKQIHVGERFVYQISYLGLTVGEAETRVKELVEYNGRKAFHVEVTVWSRSIINYLYPVRDTHHSYIDAENYHSLAYEKELNEGRYHVHEKMTYDQEKHEAQYYSFTNGSKKIMFIPKHVQDQVSAGFWFRMQDVQPHTKIIVPINADEKNWDVEIEIGNTENLTIPKIGLFEAVHIIPKLKFQGFFVRRGRIEGWMALNSARVPLMMKVKVPVLGAVVAKLVEYDPGSE